jgi:radical SAM protein with 4Fe4S-binding SPASM domain
MHNPAFCVLPWSHVSIQSTGKVFPCCLSLAHQELGNLQNKSLEEVWNGEKMREVRKQMLEGNRLTRCKRCYEIEDAGGLSKRVRANLEHKSIPQLLESTAKDGHYKNTEAIEYLELRFSNVCNFRCRTCGPEFSTGWNQDAAALDYPQHRIGLRTPLEDSEKIFEMILPLIPTLKKIYFVGGEPLLTKENYVLLDLFKEKKRTDIHLTYDTNFSKLDFAGLSALDQWKDFKHVMVSASLDGYGPQGEYIRKGMDWQEFLANRIKLKNQCPHVNFHIKTTVSVLNAFHVVDLLKVLLETKLVEPKNWFANLVSNPDHYCIRSFTPEYKDRLEDHYNEFIKDYLLPHLGAVRSENIVQQLKKIVAFAKPNGNPEHLKEFFRVTKRVDQLRKENFLHLFPEYHGLSPAE